MIETCSETFALVENLRHTADNHKQQCDGNCNVSLRQLRNAAELLIKYGRPLQAERARLTALLDHWPI